MTIRKHLKNTHDNKKSLKEMTRKKEYKCKYCGKKMHKYDYENYNGYCGKCREILEWKRTLDHVKEFEE